MDWARERRELWPNSPGFRALTTAERSSVLRRLRKRWPQPTQDWWHPLDSCLAEPSAVRLQSSWLIEELPIADFRRRAALRWSQFWAIGEGSPTWGDPGPAFQGEFVIAPEFLSPATASEIIVTPTSLDWMAYTDHNDSVFLVGEWLVDVIKELWPGWRDRVWISPVHDRPASMNSRPWWELA
jgi:hypothetical protein